MSRSIETTKYYQTRGVYSIAALKDPVLACVYINFLAGITKKYNLGLGLVFIIKPGFEQLCVTWVCILKPRLN